MTDLRTRMHDLAGDVTPLPVADDLWRRGVAARRRARAVLAAAAVVLIVSVTGTATLLGQEDREARTASGEVVEGGAIPSAIVDPGELDVTDDLAIGRASVAFVSGDGQAIAITAADGRYHALDLPGWDGELLSLSPAGAYLAWTIESDPDGRPREGFTLMDLASGDARLVPSDPPSSIVWSPSDQWLTWIAGDSVGRTPVAEAVVETAQTGKPVEWSAIDDEGTVTFYAQGPRQWGLDGTYGRMKMSEDVSFDAGRQGRNEAAVASPSGSTFALGSPAAVAAVDFLDDGRFVERPLATDLYPDGAAVRPLGWATDTLVLAQVDAPDGSYVEGPHLALLTTPNAPEESWTYRIVARDVPSPAISVAVDLIPQLDGTSSQELTYDFPVPEQGNPLALAGTEISILIGLGVAAAIAVLLGLRWLWRRLRPV